MMRSGEAVRYRNRRPWVCDTIKSWMAVVVADYTRTHEKRRYGLQHEAWKGRQFTLPVYTRYAHSYV